MVFWYELGSTLGWIADIITLLFLLLISMGLMYVFPLMARFHNTIFHTIKNSFIIALANMKYTFILLLIHVFVMSLIYIFPVFKAVILLIGFSFTAYVNSLIYTKVFHNYEAEDTAYRK